MLVIWAKAITHASSRSCVQIAWNYPLPPSGLCASLLWECDPEFQNSITQIFKQEMNYHAKESIVRMFISILHIWIGQFWDPSWQGTRDIFMLQVINQSTSKISQHWMMGHIFYHLGQEWVPELEECWDASSSWWVSIPLSCFIHIRNWHYVHIFSSS